MTDPTYHRVTVRASGVHPEDLYQAIVDAVDALADDADVDVEAITTASPAAQGGAANRPRIDAERRTPLDAGTDSSEPSTGLSGGGGREADAPPTVADPASTTCSGQGITLLIGPDGKHGDRHTPTCGCDTVQPAGLVARDAREDALDLDAIAAGEVGGGE